MLVDFDMPLVLRLGRKAQLDLAEWGFSRQPHPALIHNLESQRDSILQPRVGPPRGTTLGHPPKKSPTPTGFHPPRPPQPRTPFNPFRVDDFIASLPSVADCIANAGLNDFIPLG